MAWKRVKGGGALCLMALMSGCSAPAPVPITYLSQDPPPGALPHGELAYVDDGRCPGDQVKRLIGGDGKRNVPRKVACVPRPR